MVSEEVGYFFLPESIFRGPVAMVNPTPIMDNKTMQYVASYWTKLESYSVYIVIITFNIGLQSTPMYKISHLPQINNINIHL